MNITITFTDGTVASYTNCTGANLTNGSYEFDGTNDAGVQVHVRVNWATVKFLEEQSGD